VDDISKNNLKGTPTLIPRRGPRPSPAPLSWLHTWTERVQRSNMWSGKQCRTGSGDEV